MKVMIASLVVLMAGLLSGCASPDYAQPGYGAPPPAYSRPAY